MADVFVDHRAIPANHHCTEDHKKPARFRNPLGAVGRVVDSEPHTTARFVPRVASEQHVTIRSFDHLDNVNVVNPVPLLGVNNRLDVERSEI